MVAIEYGRGGEKEPKKVLFFAQRTTKNLGQKPKLSAGYSVVRKDSRQEQVTMQVGRGRW